MRFRKKVDPNAPPPPPRDNGLPDKPKDLDAALQSLQALLPGVNVSTGYGFSPKKKAETCWLLFVFTDDKDLQVPAEHAGYLTRRMGVPRPL